MKVASGRPIAKYHFPGEFTVAGRKFFAQFFAVTPQLFCSLGYKAELFKQGCLIGTMDKAAYRDCTRLQVKGASVGLYSFHPDPNNPEYGQVLRGTKDYLSTERRVLLVPNQSAIITLVHEIAHDIYFGGGITREQREAFARQIFRVYKAATMPITDKEKQAAPDLLNFFSEIAAKCQAKHISLIINYFNETMAMREPGFQVFATECFAYVAEMLIRPEEATLKTIPEVIKGIMPELKEEEREEETLPSKSRHRPVQGRIEVIANQPDMPKTKSA